MKSVQIICAIIIISIACKQSDPPKINANQKGFRKGDLVEFSGRQWTVKKYETNMWGPGPNYFSGNESDITVDSNGFLHMKIVNRNNKWMSTEIIGKDILGFGTYTFTVEGNFDNMPANLVLGLFTWDDYSFANEANSEVDIEIGKWGNSADPSALQYGVQPINFGTLFPERMNRPNYPTATLNSVSTHSFLWTPDSIVWKSYKGDKVDVTKRFGYWKFGKNNPARSKTENGQTSRAIIIPTPGTNTTARINFWINTWISAGPTDGKNQEVIIRKFEYTAL